MNFNFFLSILFVLILSNIGLAQNDPSKTYKKNNNFLNLEFDLKFPKDHNAHPDFKTEWWYITANLKNDSGEFFGIQWTLFRSNAQQDNYKLKKNNKNPWFSNQFWMAHSAVTTKNKHYFEEKFSRGGTGQSGVKISPFLAWIDDWEFSSNNKWSEAKVNASGDNFSYNLKLKSKGNIILHGDNGKSVKTKDGHFSAYYSQPFFSVEGTVNINKKSFFVRGNAWVDREWSNAILGSDQQGWDWFSLHLDKETKLMVFRVRDKKKGDFYSGTYIFDKNNKTNLVDKDIEMIPIKYHTKKDSINSESWKVPIEWRVVVKKYDVDIILKALNKDAFVDTLFKYWEGPINFTGSHNGLGYLEMTGY